MYWQIMGIPMGSGLAPFMAANLFLNHYEDKWIRKKKSKGLITAEKFANIFRIIDGLATLNDVGKFEKALQEFYCPEF